MILQQQREGRQYSTQSGGREEGYRGEEDEQAATAFECLWQVGRH